MRVLVADDNVDAATTLAMVLELHGFEVSIAHDGLDALALARSTMPDACLLDLGMPGLDGLELAAQLRRERPRGSALLLVAITGWTQEIDRARTTQAGFDLHLGKPADPDALVAVLQRWRTGGAGQGAGVGA